MNDYLARRTDFQYPLIQTLFEIFSCVYLSIYSNLTGQIVTNILLQSFICYYLYSDKPYYIKSFRVISYAYAIYNFLFTFILMLTNLQQSAYPFTFIVLAMAPLSYRLGLQIEYYQTSFSMYTELLYEENDNNFNFLIRDFFQNAKTEYEDYKQNRISLIIDQIVQNHKSSCKDPPNCFCSQKVNTQNQNKMNCLQSILYQYDGYILYKVNLIFKISPYRFVKFIDYLDLNQYKCLPYKQQQIQQYKEKRIEETKKEYQQAVLKSKLRDSYIQDFIIKKYQNHLKNGEIRKKQFIINECLSYLYFLMAVSEQKVLAFIEMIKYRNCKQISLRGQALISELFQQTNRNQSTNSSQKNSFLDALQYDQKLEIAEKKFQRLLKLKEELVIQLFSDHIDLVDMRDKALLIKKERDDYEKYLIDLCVANYQNSHLQYLLSGFTDIFSFGRKKSFFKKKCVQILKSKQLEKYTIIDQSLFQKDSCVVFLTLVNQIGYIQNFQNKFPSMFGYTSKEVQNKNISMIIPNPISQHHDEILKRYIKNSAMRENKELDDDNFEQNEKIMQEFPSNKSNKSSQLNRLKQKYEEKSKNIPILLGLNSKGWAVPLSLSIKFYNNQQSDCGVSSFIQVYNEDSHFLQIDTTTFQVQAITEQLYYKVFGGVIQQKEVKKLCLNRVMPFLKHFLQLSKNNNNNDFMGRLLTFSKNAKQNRNLLMKNQKSDSKDVFKSILFIPKSNVIQGNHIYKYDKVLNTNKELQAQVSLYNLEHYDLYTSKFQFYNKEHEFFQYSIIEFHSIRKISDYDEMQEVLSKLRYKFDNVLHLNFEIDQNMQYLEQMKNTDLIQKSNIINFIEMIEQEIKDQTENYSPSAQNQEITKKGREYYEEQVEENQVSFVIKAKEKLERSYLNSEAEILKQNFNTKNEIQLLNDSSAKLNETSFNAQFQQQSHFKNPYDSESSPKQINGKKVKINQLLGNIQTPHTSPANLNGEEFYPISPVNVNSSKHSTNSTLAINANTSKSQKSQQVNVALLKRLSHELKDQKNLHLMSKLEQIQQNLKQNNIQDLTFTKLSEQQNKSKQKKRVKKTFSKENVTNQNQQSKTSYIFKEHVKSTVKNSNISDKEHQAKLELQEKSRRMVAASSRHSNQSNTAELKNNLIQQMNRNKRTAFTYLLQAFGFLSFSAVMTLTLLQYYQVNTSFRYIKIDFNFIPWTTDLRSEYLTPLLYSGLIKLNKTDNFPSLKDPKFQAIVYDRMQQAYMQLFYLYDFYILSDLTDRDYFAYINRKPVELQIPKDDAVLKDKVSYFKDDKKIMNVNVDYFIQNLISYQFGVAYGKYDDPDIYLEQIQIDNYQTFKQQQQVISGVAIDCAETSNQNVLNQSITLMILVITSCFLLITAVFPLYYQVQTKNEEALKLFGTISPEHLYGMLYPIQMNLLIMKNTKQLDNLNLQEKYKKRRSISSTSTIPKFKCVLLICGILGFVTLIIQPIVNYQLLTSFRSDARKNINLLDTLYSIRSLLTNNLAINYQYLAYRVDDDPYLYNPSFYDTEIPLINEQSQDKIDKMNAVIKDDESSNRYKQELYDNFLYELLSGNICETVQKFPEYISEKNQIDHDLCVSIRSGILTKGFQIALSDFISHIVYLQQLYKIQSRSQLILEVKKWTDQTKMMEYDKYYTLLSKCVVIIKDFMILVMNDQLDYMTNIQTILLAFQIFFLTFLFVFGWINFYLSIQTEMITIKQLFSLLSLETVMENPYIVSLLNR